MRAFLLIVLLLAGCVQAPTQPSASTPVSVTSATPSPDAEGHSEAGGWRLDFSPAQIVGPYAVEATFNATLTRLGPAPEHAFLVREDPFFAFEPASPIGLQVDGNATTRFTGHVALREPATLAFELHAWNGTPAGNPAILLQGPRLQPLPTPINLTPAMRNDTEPQTPGFSARAENGSVVATFAAPRLVTSTCDATVRPLGDWYLERGPPDALVTGFFIAASNDACATLPEQWPRVQVTTPAFPPGTNVTMRAVIGVSCAMCSPGPWRVESLSVTV